jgi:hypothetical protein
MVDTEDLDLTAMAISFAWFAAGAYVALGSNIITEVFKVKANSIAANFLGVVIMSVLVYKLYGVIQSEAEARAAANAS